jgi:LPXTG-motif cell wall-anchored protein
MSRATAFFGVIVAALFATLTPAPARAQTFDKLANLTFTGPVQVPGAMLSAGTYRFKLANPDSSRNIVQVMNHDGTNVYAMFYTTPDMRMEITDEAVVTFKETPAGVPPVIRSLFYGGEHGGYEFNYYGEKPVMTATVTPQPPITYTRIPAVANPEPVVEPAPPARLAPAATEPAPVPAFEPAPATTGELVVTAEELPHTSTTLPLFAVGGLASLVLGLGAALARRRLV